MLNFYFQNKAIKLEETGLESPKHKLIRVIIFPSIDQVIISYNKSTEVVNFITLKESSESVNDDTIMRLPQFEQRMHTINNRIKETLKNDIRDNKQHNEITKFYSQRAKHLQRMQTQESQQNPSIKRQFSESIIQQSDELSIISSNENKNDKSQQFQNEFSYLMQPTIKKSFRQDQFSSPQKKVKLQGSQLRQQQEQTNYSIDEQQLLLERFFYN